MDIFFFIMTNNIVPIFILIALGYILSRKFDININTLSKINFYIFVPSFTFTNIYTTKIPQEIMMVLLITFFILIVNLSVGAAVGSLRGYEKGLKNAFMNSISFYNTGNIGIPLITLIFNSSPLQSLALTAQTMVLVGQDITTNTIGFILGGRSKYGLKESILRIFKMPSVYSIPLAFVLKLVPYDFTRTPVWPALNYAKNGLVPIALITLGAQLARTKFDFRNSEAYLSNFIRIIIGPFLGLAFVALFQLSGVIAQVVVISSALPSGVNTALIAIECDNHPDFSSQAVMSSTILCSISLIFVIYMAKVMFPV